MCGHSLSYYITELISHALTRPRTLPLTHAFAHSFTFHRPPSQFSQPYTTQQYATQPPLQHQSIAGASDLQSDRGTVRDYTAVDVAIQAIAPPTLGEEERRELRA